MTSDTTITGGDASISTTDKQTTADVLLGRVCDKIVGNAGTDEIVEGLLVKAAIDVASNLPDDGIIRSVPSGAKMLFQQSTAPMGWTKDTAHNDKALRVVAGSAGSGGNKGLSGATITATGTISTSISGSVAGHALTTAQIPSHTHSFSGNVRIPTGSQDSGAYYKGMIKAYGANVYSTDAAFSGTTGASGSGSAHSHSASGLSASSIFSSTPVDLDIAYVDVIIATKD